MDKLLKQDLISTGYIHSPLPIREEKSAETRMKLKKVLASRPLWTGESQQMPVSSGSGSVKVEAFDGNECVIHLNAPLRADHWGDGAPADGDYCNFGSLCAKLVLDKEDWSEYNRISFKVRPECDGMRIVQFHSGVRNEGEHPIPDQYYREGSHAICLKNHEWNECIWEFSAMPRDCITELLFYAGLCGRDISAAEGANYYLKDIILEKVEDPEPEYGWEPALNRISFSTTGYWADGIKTAIANTTENSFNIIDELGKTVFNGKIKQIDNKRGTFGLLDFSKFKSGGKYKIQAGEVTTESFEIGDEILESSVWKVINFLFCERCGYPVPKRHGVCHHDFIAKHNGLSMSYAGGWHDAGDVSQQTAQTAEVTHALFELAKKIKSGNKDKPLYLRIMEEAQWGLEFILRTRFGDGYRATSAGATRWSNGLIGDMDDVNVRVHNHAFENFLFAGIEAFAAEVLKDYDADLAWGCADTAKKDYNFALERYREHGKELPNMYEHTYNSGDSQYYATASWAASNIYAVTKDENFATLACEFGEKLLECQETGKSSLPITGFFYRDNTHKSIVHFTHQSREQAFIQAIERLCVTQPNHKNKSVWENAMKLYGNYIKSLMQYTSPYGLIPAGVYKLDEAEDKETFELLHLLVSYEKEKENYIEQVKNGIPIGNDHYIKCFPVWFSFRGNTAIHLSMGKAASIIGSYFNDYELIEIAREQLYWVCGKNPFGQSFIYGEGSNYSSQYAVLPGEMVGELPVGVETFENDDIPYWPQNNNATYKEVWTTSAGRWLWIAADLFRVSPVGDFPTSK